MVIVVEPSYEIWSNVTSGSELQLMQQTEKAGRVCYKSEDRITPDSAAPFVKMILGRNHGSVLEHNTIVLKIPLALYHTIKDLEDDGKDGMPLFLQKSNDKSGVLLSGTIRAFRSFHLYFASLYPELRVVCGFLAEKYPTLFGDLPDLERVDGITLVTDIANFSKMEKLRHISATVKLVCDRGVSHEIVRNKQQITFSQSSTRYCNYSLGKFGSQITVIRPEEYIPNTQQYDIWLKSMIDAEWAYMMHTKYSYNVPKEEKTRPITAQIARDDLPNSLMTEVVITATLWEWREIFKQRSAPAAHPQMRQLMIPLQKELEAQYPAIV